MTTITLRTFPESDQPGWKGSREARGQIEGKTFQFLAPAGEFKKGRQGKRDPFMALVSPLGSAGMKHHLPHSLMPVPLLSLYSCMVGPDSWLWGGKEKGSTDLAQCPDFKSKLTC